MLTLHNRIHARRESTNYVDIADIIEEEYDRRCEEIGPTAASLELVASSYADKGPTRVAIKAVRRALAYHLSVSGITSDSAAIAPPRANPKAQSDDQW